MKNTEDNHNEYTTSNEIAEKPLINLETIILSDSTLTESKKQKLLKLCIKYNSIDENFFNRDDFIALYKFLKYDNLLHYEVLKSIIDNFAKYTKHDTELTRETLSNNEVIQALNTSISKFKELHYQQPKELKHILIDYQETPIKDYIEVIQNAINHDKDIKLLDKQFLTYKRDTQGRIYNYDLLAFLYYAYSLKISFEHLYHSELLKLLGAYTFKSDRDKPVLKNNKTALLQQHIKAVELSQCEENIYLHNLITFVKAVNTRHSNKYLLSFLVDMSHNLKASKEFMQSLTGKNNFKNDTYEKLPQPINTLLLPFTEIAN